MRACIISAAKRGAARIVVATPVIQQVSEIKRSVLPIVTSHAFVIQILTFYFFSFRILPGGVSCARRL
jgi:hypothetical protein